MSIRFNADEVFRMAVQIERNGGAFYRRAAELQPGHGDLLLRLAAMEDGHERVFEGMRQELSAKEHELTAYDPLGEGGLYLEAMADGHGGEGSPVAAASLTGRESMADILRLAIGLEKKSVLFYLGLRDMVPPLLGQSRIDRIIGEEKQHIVTLSRELHAVRTT